MTNDIERVQGLTRGSFLRKHGYPGKPALIADITRNWTAMERWTPDFFRERFGDVMVTLQRSRAKNDKRTTSFSDFMGYIEETVDKDPYYLTDWPFRSDAPQLSDDYQPPGYFESWLDRLPATLAPNLCWLYIGPAGSGSAMHQDAMMTSAWNAVIFGQKRWLFYPPDQGEQLYYGKVDAFNPDLEKYPLFSQACAPLECTQRTGEVVFAPSGWWHQVVNEKAGISVTENFINESNLEIARETILDNFKHHILKFHIPELFE